MLDTILIRKQGVEFSSLLSPVITHVAHPVFHWLWFVCLNAKCARNRDSHLRYGCPTRFSLIRFDYACNERFISLSTAKSEVFKVNLFGSGRDARLSIDRQDDVDLSICVGSLQSNPPPYRYCGTAVLLIGNSLPILPSRDGRVLFDTFQIECLKQCY